MSTITLPQLPVIHAVDIYAAQGFRLAEQPESILAILREHADFQRGLGLEPKIRLGVVHPTRGTVEGTILVYLDSLDAAPVVKRTPCYCDSAYHPQGH